MPVKIEPIRLLKDNYAWLLYSAETTLLFDPGEAGPIEQRLQNRKLTAIFITHHHSDHTAGARKISDMYNAPIYGPENCSPTPDYILKGGETLEFGNITLKVFSSPGHAKGHLTYYNPQIPALVSGDVLFSGGCGRLFEGTASELFQSIKKFSSFPDDTLLCAAHEYTVSNLEFIKSLPRSLFIKDEDVFHAREAEVLSLRQQNKPTLPVRLGVERGYNPFIRARTAEEFAKFRALKDQF